MLGKQLWKCHHLEPPTMLGTALMKRLAEKVCQSLLSGIGV